MCLFRRVDGYEHQLIGVAGTYGCAEFTHNGRQKGCCNTYAVLHVKCGNLWISSNIKGHPQAHTAAIAAAALHIFHARGTVYLLFNGDSRCLLYRLRIGTRIAGVHTNAGRGNIRILIDGKVENAYHTRYHQNKRNDDSGYRPFYKSIGDHASLVLCRSRDFCNSNSSSGSIFCASTFFAFSINSL